MYPSATPTRIAKNPRVNGSRMSRHSSPITTPPTAAASPARAMCPAESTYMGARMIGAQSGQRAPTGDCTRQEGQIGDSQRLQRRAVSTLEWRGHRTVSGIVNPC